MISSDIARLIAKPVPRYTSYPTAPHFHAGIGAAQYRGWIEALPEGATLSLYLHIPFCDSLCWFCGCHTRVTRRYEPVGIYLGGLMREISMIGALAPKSVRVTHIHWGGGSPSMLSPEDIERLSAATRAAFTLDPACEFAVEMDPRGLDQARIDAFAAAGLTRVSLGVQDFDPKVQWAINREQSFEETKRAVEGFRAKGIRSLNIDAIYGLPHQDGEKLISTLEQVMALEPDRIALFGYAHVPWMKKHQEMIDPESLPGTLDRFRQAENAADFLLGAGYTRVGIDHFALSEDSLAMAASGGTLRRNFQGYTVDPADALIGLGASAISSLPQGYAQNEAATGRYLAQIAEGRLTATRGLALSDDDRLRRGVIESLMCHLRLDDGVLADLPGSAEQKQAIRDEMEQLKDDVSRGWVEWKGDILHVTESGRPFLRLIVSRFDAWLANSAGRHSVAV